MKATYQFSTFVGSVLADVIKSSHLKQRLAMAVVVLSLAGEARAAGIAFSPPPGGWAYSYEGAGDSYGMGGAVIGNGALDGNWTHGNGSDSWAEQTTLVADRPGAGNGLVGGVGSLTEADPASPGGMVTFLRMVDGITAGSTSSDNRRFYFMRDLSTLPGYTATFMNSGVTISFRARLVPDAALEGALTPANKGGMVGGDGKGMFGFRQASGDQIVTFSLHTATEDGAPTPAFSGAGLTLNKNVGDVPSNAVGNPSSAGFPQNDLALDPNVWHEFWITIVANDATPGNGTHTATLYVDGITSPAGTFNFTAGNGDEGTSTSPVINDYLELGQNFTPLNGAFDTDFFAITFGAVAPQAPEAYPSAVLADGPIAYYRFSEPAVAPRPPDVAMNLGSLSAAGNGMYLNCPSHPQPGALAGSTDTAATFDGQSQKVNVPFSTGLNPSAPFSIEAWARLTGFSNFNRVVLSSRFNVTGNQRGYQLLVRNTAGANTWRFTTYNGTGGNNLDGPIAQMNAWTHVVAVNDGSVNRLYVNGVLANTSAAVTYVANTNEASVLRIAGGTPENSGADFWPGGLDEVAVYNTALSAAQIAAHYENGTNAAPASPYNQLILADGPVGYWRLNEPAAAPCAVAANSGSLGAAANATYFGNATPGAEAPRPPAFTGFGNNNTAVQLNGLDSHVASVSGLLNSLPRFTISGWIRRAADQANRTGLFGQNDIVEMGYIDNNTIQIWTDNGLNIAPNPFPNGQWSHVAMVSEGSPGTIRLYTNGVLAGSRSHVLPTNNAFRFNIGGGGVFDASRNFFNGQIDEVAVFDKALSAEQIANHYFSSVAQAPVITRQPQGTNIFEGDTLVLSVGVAGSPPLQYQWLYFGTDIAGQTAASLVISNATTSDSGSYSVRVSNQYGTVESDSVEVNVMETQPPIITQEPQSQTRYAGRTARFTVAATGGANLQYRWQFNGADLPGQTSPTLTLNNISSANTGPYQAIVANTVGSVTSMVAVLTVVTPAANSYAGAVVGENPLAYWRLGETSGSTAIDAWGGFDGTYMNVILGVPGALAGDPDTAAEFNGTSSAVTTPLSLNGLPAVTMTGWIRRGGTQAGRTGLFGQNDLIEFGYIDNNTLQLWVDNFQTPVNISPNPFPDGEWDFLAVIVDNGNLSVYTNASAGGTASLGSSTYGTNAFLFNIGGGGIFDVSGNFFLGGIDEVAVFDRALTANQVANLYFTGSHSPPVIVTQPQGTNLFEGGTIRLCVDARGAPPVTYKWLYFGGEIAGQTNACLVISNAMTAHSGSYQVEVRSPQGSVLSEVAEVDVMPSRPPVITQNPQSATRYAGGTVTFTGAASGSDPLTYQWQHNDADIPGATSSTLMLNNLQPSDAGNYKLIAANTLGRATSAVATLTIIELPPGSYAAGVMSHGPMAYWRLGETSGDTAFDYVGGNHGTYHDVLLGLDGAISGDPDKAAGFNGTSSYVSTPVSLNGLSNLTMAGWILRNGPQNPRTGLFGQNDLVEFGYIDNDTIQAWVDNFDNAVNVTPNPIPDQQWGFVALTLENGALTVQVNDEPDGTATLPSGNYGTSADRFNIGGGGIFDTLANNGNWFNGRIDEVMLFNRALSTEELNALYLAGLPHCPVAQNQAVETGEDTSANITLMASDPDGDTLTYTIVSGPANGTLSGTPPNVTYAPNTNFCGSDGFTWKVSDGQCETNATVSIRVFCANDCPTAVGQSLSVDQDSQVNFQLQASDPDGDPLQYAVTQPPAHGAVAVLIQSGAGTYTPTPGYCGPDSFRFRVTDGQCSSAEATVNITVRCLNQPPTGCVAAIGPTECTLTNSDGTLSVVSMNGADACVVLQGSATDPEGQPLQYSWWTNGTVFAMGATVTNCFDLGCHTVTFTATDPGGLSCSTNLTFCVISPAEAVEQCITLVDNADLGRKNKRPLIASLKAAAASFDRGNFEAGLNQLHAFENKVRAQIEPGNPAAAQAFTDCAQRIMEAVACSALMASEGSQP